jgi:hypothetical protein
VICAAAGTGSVPARLIVTNTIGARRLLITIED